MIQRMRWRAIAALIALGVAACGDFIVQTLIALGEAPVTEVRIAASNYISLDKGDTSDGYNANGGYLCVAHSPGCGWVGNSGTDKFFGTAKPLPLLVQVIGVDYTPIPPAPGLTPSNPGGIGGWGSFGSQLTVGSGDGTQPTTVKWDNACQGTYAGKVLYYQISFRVRVRGDVAQLNEPTFDVAAKAPQCGAVPPIPPASMPAMPSGFLGVVKLCNPTTQNTSGTLVLAAECSPAQPSKPSCVMNESIPLQFLPSGGGQPSSTNFMTKQTYQQGAWTITKAHIQGLTGPLPGLPLSVQLPGGVGAPVLDFSGGSCTPR